MDHDVAWLHQRQQDIAARRYTSACHQRSLEIRADVIAAGYLHPYVLVSCALPPVTRPLLNAHDGRSSKRLRQAVGVAGRETRNIDTEPYALGGIASLGRIRRLRDLGLRRTQTPSQGIRVWFHREPDRRLDESAVCLGQTQLLRVP
jgi:hypothetical protein